jgi:hypothetical protein
MSLCRQWFGADDETPLYALDVVAARRPRRPDGLSGFGDFPDLERLLVREVAR